MAVCAHQITFGYFFPDGLAAATAVNDVSNVGNLFSAHMVEVHDKILVLLPTINTWVCCFVVSNLVTYFVALSLYAFNLRRAVV